MKSIIEKYNIRNVWHFTDQANIESIKQHGLLSLAECRRRGIAIPEPGGDAQSHNSDTKAGLDDFVRLTFNHKHPMLWVVRTDKGRIPNPVWLAVHVSVLFREGVRFATGIAYAGDSEILNAAEAEEQVDFEALFTYVGSSPDASERWKKAQKAEILIPNAIPTDKIGFPNQHVPASPASDFDDDIPF